MTSEDVFNAAVAIVQGMPKEGPVKSSNDEKLAFYSLFKQATQGPCAVAKPAFWNVVEGYKWQAWKDLGEMSREKAMDQYVERLRRKIDIVNEHHDISDWMLQDEDSTERLRHNFVLIGCPLSGMCSKETVEKCNDSEDVVRVPEEKLPECREDQRESEAEDVQIQYTYEITDPITSDAEYCDAKEESDVASRTSESPVPSRRARQHVTSSQISIDTNLLQEMQREIVTLTKQVSHLTTLLEQRQNVLLDFVMKTTVHMLGLPHNYGLSWKTIVFFLIWPLVVHYFLKYRKLIAMIPSLLINSS